MALPTRTKYLIIGAGIHGLSTAWHLGRRRCAESARGSGKDILVVDKTDIAAGASGIACGVIRNNYYQPAMRRLMAHSVSVWESDPRGLQLSPRRLHADQPRGHARAGGEIAEQQKEIGYESVFIEGEKESHGLHEGPVRRLAGQGHHLGAAREEGRLRQQHRLDPRPGRQGRAGGRPHPDRREGHRLREGHQRRGAHGADQPGQHRLRLRGRRRRSLGQADLGHAGAAGRHHHQGP